LGPLVGLTAVWESADDARRYRLSHRYAAMVEDAGGEPLVVLPGSGRSLLRSLSLLVLTGGGDPDPVLFGRPGTQVGPVELERPRWEMDLYRRARDLDLPVLGICMGMQLMAIAHGAGLIQHIPHGIPNALDHSKSPDGHPLQVVGEGPLARTLHGLETVNSYHHQAIDRVPRGLVLAGRAPDGVIEAIETESGSPSWGVQWHPERDGSWNRLLPPLLSRGRDGGNG